MASVLRTETNEIPYSARITLSEVGPSRVGFQTHADLRHFQAALPEMLSLDLNQTCRAHLELGMERVSARLDALDLSGRISAALYECEGLRTDPATRGSAIYQQGLTLELTAAAVLEDQCLFMRVDQVALTPDRPTAVDLDLEEEVLERARAVSEAAAEILSRVPICPDFPPELQALDARLQKGGTKDIGAGYLGAYLEGHIDVSPAAIVALLNALQHRGVLPPRP
ncbi:hypothetical protein LCL97_23840 [Seohaeicola saemankumensis]|nr:hypothetical protein [Seohaeicola saemankumensis]MCA0873875.1 hypothetical protein [Seohaeicola saemankumensis]